MQKEKKIIRYAEDIGLKSEVTLLPDNSGPSTLKNSKVTFEIPFKLNNMLDQDLLYPYSIDSNVDIKCETQNLNTKKISSKKNQLKVPSLLLQNSFPAEKNLSDEDTGCDPRFRCVNISCSILLLDTPLVGVRLTSYLWVQSFEKETNFTTHVRAWFYNLDTDADLTTDSVLGPIEIPLLVLGAHKAAKKVSLLTLVSSIAGGLIGLSLIVLILKKVGFFKRKRPPKAEFYSATNPNLNDQGVDNAVLDVKDNLYDTVDDDEDDDEEDNQFAFTNPVADVNFDNS